MAGYQQILLKKAFILCLFASLWACGSKINEANYKRIEDGMTMEQVVEILGEPTESQTAGIGPLSGTSAIWKDDNGATINLKLVNGKVQFKTFNEVK